MKKCKTKLTALLLAALMISVFAGCTGQSGTESSGLESSAASAADAASKEEESSAKSESETESKTENSAGEEPETEGIDYMVLVNKTHPLPEDWEEKLETVHMTNSVGDDVEVEKKAYDAYLKLKEELEKEDIHVDLDSARRSVADQQRIMDDFTEQYGKE